MEYPFKYPILYGELAMQGKTKKELARALQISPFRLQFKQSIYTTGDFKGEEMKNASDFLNRPIAYLFALDDCVLSEEKQSAFLL